MSIKTIIRKSLNTFVYYNWKVAKTIWQCQSAIIRYLTDSDGDTVVLGCGIAGIVYPRYLKQVSDIPDPCAFWGEIKSSPQNALSLLESVRLLKTPQKMFEILNSEKERQQLSKLASEIRDFVASRVKQISNISSQQTEKITQENLWLLDSAWSIQQECIDFADYVVDLFPEARSKLDIFCECLAIAAVLRGLDKKLETRGRDSCGLSVMFTLDKKDYNFFVDFLNQQSLAKIFNDRCDIVDLKNYALRIYHGEKSSVFTFTYKVAKAVGQLGDNVALLQKYIKEDRILRALLCNAKHEFSSAIVHTRWASQGVVSIENCHPVDNSLSNCKNQGSIYTVLNGDIDNYLEIRHRYENDQQTISEQITTDAKIIPIVIDRFFQEDNNLDRAFCKAIKVLNGSFAIEMHSSLEPGKIYLAQQGKGQGLYVGISEYGYHIASEIYGFVEQTAKYISMEPGQIIILDQNSSGGIDAIRAFDTNGQPIALDLKTAQTPITTRDVFLDTTKFQHFLQKEIHEAPQIIEKTLCGKWLKTTNGQITTNLGSEILPLKIRDKLQKNEYRYVYFVGMGTAHAAGEAIAATFANILQEHSELIFSSLLATEFMATYTKKNRQNTLVIGVSQSGGTTDTNAAIRKFIEDKADVLGIINKRDSDMSFLVDGVLYTGDGRDVEIAVASTKAFYAQVVAGTLYALEIAKIQRLSGNKIHEIVSELLEIPSKLETLFARRNHIKNSAYELAPKHVYWDTLSTGIGKPVARELKIKLSELCYMSIPSFAAANKKHINLSAEALILCFLGAVDFSGISHQGALAKDLRGEIAIFLAQSNTPIVITTENDITYDDVVPEDKQPYQLLKVLPEISPTFSVIMNTAAGHLWAYYAAQALNRRSLFLAQILDDFHNLEATYENSANKQNIMHSKDFQKCMSKHYKNYRDLIVKNDFNNGLLTKDASELEKLFLLILQVIPASATSVLFDENWSSERILQEFKSKLSYLRTWLCRSIDAIKHQAKYITVGVTGFEGITDMPDGVLQSVFQNLLQQNLLIRYEEDVNEYDLITLSNIQCGIGKIIGGLLYDVYEQEQQIFLQVVPQSAFGDSQNQTSRYNSKAQLRGGRKAIAIKNDKVNIGKGHDNKNTISIPIRSLGKISKILLCRFETNENIEPLEKVTLLGGLEARNSKATEIFIAVQENREQILAYHNINNNILDDCFLAKLLQQITVKDLLLLSHEDISEKIIDQTQQ
ncbi:SIS domain-containing protein [Candidatus Uabimicrobium sp. HlEnr_7]|uniref:SIS domain-containing protein n=1 Tax=Candidatus Uabimicrobium helgolandensis TaxID=3095367 RepID=UPI0035579E7E